MSLIIFIGEISTKFLCNPRRFLLVHWLNSWFLFVHSSTANLFFKTTKRIFENSRENVKLSVALDNVLLVHRNRNRSVVEGFWKYYCRVSNCDFEELCPINIISPICFQLNHKENENKDRSSDATLKSQKQVGLLYTYKYPFLPKSLNSVLWPTLYGPRRSDTWIVFYIVHCLCLPPPPHPSFRVWYMWQQEDRKLLTPQNFISTALLSRIKISQKNQKARFFIVINFWYFTA
jgi:hypothetical protein